MASASHDGSARSRVLWLTENHPPSRGGMAQSSDRIVRGLRVRDIAIDVAHLTRAPKRHRVERVQGGHHLTVPLDDDVEHALRRLWLDIERLHHEPSAGPYTHVVAFGGTLPLLAAPTYARWLAVPLVTLLRGNDFDTGLFSVRRRAGLLDALEASAVVATVASRNVDLVRRLVPKVDVAWIANGIDLDAWDPLPSERARAATWRATHVDPAHRTIGLIGQLKRKKGAVLFFEALARSRFASTTHVLLVGDAEQELTDWLVKHDDKVHWTHLPFLDRYELLAYYPACDLVALPSFYDGLPNVALEAAAVGVPLLASDAGGLADLVVDGVNGYAFAAGDAAGCRRAIDRALAATDEELGARGAAARATVAAGFRAEAEATAYADLLASIR